MYEKFARLYDRFMRGADYSRWAAYIDGVFKRHSVKTVLDLACGTGCITIPLAKLGYDLTAVDISPDMLSEARDKADEQGYSILFLMQDMRSLDLFDTVDGTVCTCDALNYLLSEKDLSAAFKHVSLFLNLGGIFIFDVATEYKYKDLMGNKTFTDKFGGASYIWKNYYDSATGINEYDIFFMVKDPPLNFSENHFQRSYSIETVKGLLEAEGFKIIQISDDYSDNPPTADSERVTFVAVKE